MKSSRVGKKLIGPLRDVVGAILMVNALDPQVATIDVFLDAISDIPHFIVINKSDLVTTEEANELAKKFEHKTVVLAAITEDKGLMTIRKQLLELPLGRVAILGVFNSGKTSLINALTGEDNPVGDIPGTTLEFTEHHYIDRILLDTVGQIIDVSKPLMVSIDLEGCKTIEDRILRCFSEEIDGVSATMTSALLGTVKAVEVILEQVGKGNKVVVAGAGASALVAMEMAGQGQETGLPIMVFTNNFADSQPVNFAKGIGETEFALAEYCIRSVQKGDVCIAISASGGTGFTYAFLQLAREKGATSIAITENIDTPLGKAADIIIKSNAKPEGPSSSKIQIAHLAIGHALILTVADMRGITAEKAIEYMMPSFIKSKKVGIK